MCGIFGYMNFDMKEKVEKEILIKMGQALAHRGPDGTGFHIDGNVGFGHNRLAIIDLNTGEQPLSNEDGKIWASCNGEIYNYRSLTEILEGSGHKFRTKSDAEVLVHLYEEKGVEFIKALNGMFSFLLWDKKERKIFLVRDRFGIKPLYYFCDGDMLIFASELKSILVHPKISREVDYTSIQYYFTYGYLPDPACIFKGIKKLPPATYLCLSGPEVSVKEYWSLFPAPEKENTLGEKLYLDKTHSLLESSVEEHLASDVPLGLFLSGGVDSSIIAYLAATRSGKKLKAFNIAYDEPGYDESGYAELAAHNLDIEYLTRKISPEQIITSARKIIETLDEPIADASFIPTYFLSSFAREHVKVCLSGDGADEIFAGYPSYLAQPIAEVLRRIPLPIVKGMLRKIIGSLPVRNSNNKLDFLLQLFITAADYADTERGVIWFGPFAPHQTRRLFIKEPGEKDDLFMPVKKYIEGFDFGEQLEKYLAIDRRFYLPGDILTKVDRASMANSLEVRVPYLDHRIVEFVNTLPARFKLSGFRNKYILKKAFADNLHSSLVKRRKQGFNIGISKLLKNGLLRCFEDILCREFIERQGIFEYGYIKNLISEHMSSKKDNRRSIWAVIVFQVWFNKYFNS